MATKAKKASKHLPMPEGVCYGWDAWNKHVLRFQTGYQRHLWISNGHADYPEDRQELDETHYLVRRVVTWTPMPTGYDFGTP